MTYYDGLTELKEVTDEKIANEALKMEGWKLLAIKEQRQTVRPMVVA